MLGRTLASPLDVKLGGDPFDTSSFDPEEFEDGLSGAEMLAKEVGPYEFREDAWDATF
jgi:hypothetical protein